jgi:RNA polymerase sigma factor (sigma-70 family)
VAIQRFGIAPEDADALVHDIFATWLTNPGVVRGDIRKYLLGAIWNAARAFRRKRREEPFDESAPEPAMIPDEFLEQLSTNIAVGRALARLNKRCVETLRRFYYEEESASTIAMSLDSTPDAVRQMLRVCRARARAICEEIMRERNASHP